MRPIVLLDTFRKSIVRIIQKILNKIFTEKHIRKELNFAGLPGNSTSTPIHIVNNLIEYVKEEKIEMWILLQDIRKAFNSVSIISIKKALGRFQVPRKIAAFILELYSKRNIKVITKYGMTEGFEAKEEIDKGEIISLLVW
ncbi:reverse transcriptase [Gigaspora margarita]|uniref:Reverse transcriptase n=1 Tax=Gigaspora margarita TaxID=4874 RepID=A0A8H4A4U9_GIGMA|nr:reverse transcriptase [Gigaspora margarita]